MARKSEPRECKCGCGDWTRGGMFVMGHNARYESAQKAEIAQARELVDYFTDRGDLQWLNRAAQRFCGVQEFTHPMQVARAVISHPLMQDTPRNRANGYTAYTTPSELRSRILHACS